ETYLGYPRFVCIPRPPNLRATRHSAQREENTTMKYEPVIGLEVHAELLTRSKMFCGCEVVDSITAQPNHTICPVCTGQPRALPGRNKKGVELAIRVGLALGCEIHTESIFARKNY